MKKKVAIIDSLKNNGSSHHFYLFGQIRGLVDNKVNVFHTQIVLHQILIFNLLIFISFLVTYFQVNFYLLEL